MMLSPGLQIYLWPRVNYTFDLLDPGCCDRIGIYRNMCLPGLAKICWIDLDTFGRNGFL